MLIERRLIALGALATLAAAACKRDSTPTGNDGTTPPPAPSAVSFSGGAVGAQIAATRAARETGLMGVTKLAADSGMLFVFADDRQRAFWMKNTPIPLSIAFMDANKRVIFLADMAPNDTLLRYGGFDAPPMRYALEVNEGWFAAHGVNVGSVAAFTLPTGLVIEPDP